jgi:lambda family phage portal protein
MNEQPALYTGKAPAILGGRMARAIDRFIGVFAPSAQLQRMHARNKIAFAYQAAKVGRNRQYPDRLRNPENPIAQRDNVMLMRRSRELDENSGFFSSIKSKVVNYSIGPLRYLPRTRSARVNGQIKEWWKHWQTVSDATGRFHFLDQSHLLLGSTVTDGDHGLAMILDPRGNLVLQNIEADRIGNPYHVGGSDESLIRGIHIEESRPVAYDIWHRSINDIYTPDATVPAQAFLHYYRPERYDQYRGISAFAKVVGLYQDVREVREAEMMAIKWASSKGGFVKASGAPLPSSILDRGIGNNAGMQSIAIAPGEILYGQPGDEIDFLASERPNPNLMAFLNDLLREGALGLDLPFGFVYDASGIQGTAVRLISEQAKRTFERWQGHLQRAFLERVKNAAILSGIAQGAIDWTDDFDNGKWIFPAHPTVDIGRESDANLAENRQALKTAEDIFGEQGKDAEEEQQIIGAEAERIIRIAQRVSRDTGVSFEVALNLIQMVTPNQSSGAASGPDVVPPAADGRPTLQVVNQ